MDSMFNSSGLTIIDVSSFDTSNVAAMTYMFYNSSVITIYASNKFVTNNVEESSNMFSASTNLVGGNGTRQSASHTDKEYARIDTANAPGYFTSK